MQALTAEQSLDRHGVTWRQLEKIAGKALHDAMRARNITLDEDRRERAHEFFVELGVEWAKRYDPELADGVSFTSSLYRRLYGNRVPGAKLIDFLRREHGDQRRGTPLHVVAAGDHHDFADAFSLDEESFEQLVDAVGAGLTRRGFDTLRTVAFDVCVLGLERWRVAEKRGIAAKDITDLLEELGWQLRRIGAVAA